MGPLTSPVSKIPNKVKIGFAVYMVIGFIYYNLNFQTLWGSYANNAAQLTHLNGLSTSSDPMTQFNVFMVLIWPFLVIYQLFYLR